MHCNGGWLEKRLLGGEVPVHKLLRLVFPTIQFPPCKRLPAKLWCCFFHLFSLHVNSPSSKNSFCKFWKQQNSKGAVKGAVLFSSFSHQKKQKNYKHNKPCSLSLSAFTRPLFSQGWLAFQCPDLGRGEAGLAFSCQCKLIICWLSRPTNESVSGTGVLLPDSITDRRYLLPFPQQGGITEHRSKAQSVKSVTSIVLNITTRAQR